MNIEISVIICTYNRGEYIYETLSRIAQNTFPTNKFEIILVNNNSTDNTKEECSRFSQKYPQINYSYFLEKAQGLSHARNRGIREAHGNMLTFLDDDSFVNHNYLQLLSNYLQQYPDASAYGGRITPLFEDSITPEWLSKWSYIWVSAIDKGDKVCLFKGRSYPIGANMGIKRSAIPDGCFNTNLGRSKDNLMGGEEKDIFHRIKASGGKIYYFPAIEIQHVIPPHRTTKEYIKKLAQGAGKSEQIRTLKISRLAYLKSLFLETAKWGVSILLCIYYTLSCSPRKGCILIYFRWFVSKSLFIR